MTNLLDELMTRPLKPRPLGPCLLDRQADHHRYMEPICANPEEHIKTREGRLSWLSATGGMTIDEQVEMSRLLHQERKRDELDELRKRVAGQKEQVEAVVKPLIAADKEVWDAIVAQKRAMGGFATQEQLYGVLLEVGSNKNDELGAVLNMHQIEEKVQRALRPKG